VLELPRLGCINVHASLLPRWRGAAPIQRALLAGDRVTGISIMQMEAGLDTGPVLLQESIPITPDDTAQTLHDRLATLGGQMIVRALDAPLTAAPQNEGGATYAPKIEKREAALDWQLPAEMLERKIRAFNPAPGATTSHEGVVLKIWQARLTPPVQAQPGSVHAIDSTGITIACGSSGAIKLLEVQRAGGKRMPAPVFTAGYPIRPGDRLGS
jgi:methionyl-tRNA formyltransferase